MMTMDDRDGGGDGDGDNNGDGDDSRFGDSHCRYRTNKW